MSASTAIQLPHPDATMTFTVRVGRLARRRVERALRTAAHGWVDLDIQREMGPIDGHLLVTAKGSTADLIRFNKGLPDFLQQPMLNGSSSEGQQ